MILFRKPLYANTYFKFEAWDEMAPSVSSWMHLYKNAGVTLGLSIHGFTTIQELDFISDFKGFLEQILEIHGFTGTRGTRPNAAPAYDKMS